jgi:hypothetical protein
MRPLTLESATAELVGSRLYCTYERRLYPVVTVTSVEPWPMAWPVPSMVFIGFTAEDLPNGEALLELFDHPGTKILVDARGAPWMILEPGEDPPT